jgi:Chromo (CHRromatin Organisation MOdifier) domain
LGQFVAEFAINNAWQESIGDTPFFLSFGQHPQTLLTWTGAGESASKIPAVTQFVGRFSESLSAAKRDLQVAEQRQKAYADMQSSSRSFSVGDHVLLSSRNLKLKKAPAGARKLMPRWLGPFPVVDEVGTVAYRLELPASMRVHPVFHLSFLKPFHRDSDEGREQPPPPPVVIDGEEEYQVERLLDVRKVRGGRGYRQECLAKWLEYGHEHNSWEPLAHLNENCQEDVDRLLAEH